MQDDILEEVFSHLHDDRLFDVFPIWGTLLDRSIFDNGRSMCRLALVCRGWVQTARRVALRHAILHISPRNAPVFLELVQNHGRGLWVRTLILDLPLAHEQMSHDAILSFIGRVIDACPNVTSLHLDNIPSSLAPFPQLVSHITSPLITSLAMRSVGPRSASSEDKFVPEATIDVPHLPRLRKLGLWGYNICSIASQHPAFLELHDLHLYMCHSKSFLRSLTTVPLRNLFIGKDVLDKATLSTVLRLSPGLEAFNYHFLLVGGNLLTDELGTMLCPPETVVRSCDHPLGFTSRAAERRINIMQHRESRTYTDHCYALGFEIPVSSAIDLSMRIGAEFNVIHPPWFVLGELHNLEAYLTSYAKQRIWITRVHLPVPPPRPNAPFRLFVCFQVVPLLGAQLLQDALVPIEVDEHAQCCLKQLLGCPNSPTSQYLLQSLDHDFAASL